MVPAQGALWGFFGPKAAAGAQSVTSCWKMAAQAAAVGSGHSSKCSDGTPNKSEYSIGSNHETDTHPIGSRGRGRSALLSSPECLRRERGWLCQPAGPGKQVFSPEQSA